MRLRTMYVLLALLCLSACSIKEEKQVAPVRVETERVSGDDSFHWGSYVGEVEPESSTAVSFPGSGTVQKVMVDCGQTVRKGQQIAVMDPTQSQNAVMAAEAMMMQAEDAYNRMKELHERKSISEMDWVEVQSKYAQVQSNVQIAKKMLADCYLTAPCSGVIGQKLLESGQVALPSQPICTILSVDKVKVVAHVPEKEIGLISDHSSSRVFVEALNRTYESSELEKGVEADNITRTYTVKIEVDNSDLQLLPGMVCNVKIDLAGHAGEGSVITVPITAVQRSASGDIFVWKVKDGKAFRNAVVLGDVQGNRIAVKQGLSAKDVIVVKGCQKLSEGSEVVERPTK